MEHGNTPVEEDYIEFYKREPSTDGDDMKMLLKRANVMATIDDRQGVMHKREPTNDEEDIKTLLKRYNVIGYYEGGHKHSIKHKREPTNEADDLKTFLKRSQIMFPYGDSEDKMMHKREPSNEDDLKTLLKKRFEDDRDKREPSADEEDMKMWLKRAQMMPIYEAAQEMTHHSKRKRGPEPGGTIKKLETLLSQPILL